MGRKGAWAEKKNWARKNEKRYKKAVFGRVFEPTFWAGVCTQRNSKIVKKRFDDILTLNVLKISILRRLTEDDRERTQNAF